MRLQKLFSTSPELKDVARLYEGAFPENERWGLDAVLNDKSGISELLGIFEGDMFCGFVILLNFKDITHIIYFAVEESMRGHGCGSKALRLIREAKPGNRLLVDIEREMPDAENNEQRRRRKAFYERNGYREANVHYNWNGESYEIMILDGEITTREYFKFWHAVDDNSEIFAR